MRERALPQSGAVLPQRVGVSVCVCVTERKRERESKGESVCVDERELQVARRGAAAECVCVCVSEREREREGQRESVCVRERAREGGKERERGRERESERETLQQARWGVQALLALQAPRQIGGGGQTLHNCAYARFLLLKTTAFEGKTCICAVLTFENNCP